MAKKTRGIAMITALSVPKVETHTSAAIAASRRGRRAERRRRPRPAASAPSPRSRGRAGRRRWPAGRSPSRQGYRPGSPGEGCGRGSRTSPERQVTSCQPLYAQSTVTTPSPKPLQLAGAEGGAGGPGPAARRSEQERGGRQRENSEHLRRGGDVLDRRPEADRAVLRGGQKDDERDGDAPDLAGRERHQPPQVLGEDERDRAGTGRDDEEVQPSVEERGERPVCLAQVDVNARPRWGRAPRPPPARAPRRSPPGRPRPR